ncbi:MAG: hypothetical protein Q9215_004830 [Flavoplaca cf. flavocitrina]
MPSSSSICRSFWALLWLLLSVLLVYILGDQFEKPSHYLSNTSDYNVPIDPVRFLAIPYGQQASKLEFSPVSPHNTRVGKRALDYQNLVDTGKGFVCQINDAFQDPINRVPPRIWNGFFKDNGFKFPEPADKVNIELRQDKPYHNKAGELIQVWSGLPNNNAGSLRYIAHDYVSNPTTEALMDKLFGAAFRGDKEVPWPGLPFGLDSDEGKALLAALNGLGTARILIDRVATLGRRKVTVNNLHGG